MHACALVLTAASSSAWRLATRLRARLRRSRRWQASQLARACCSCAEGVATARCSGTCGCWTSVRARVGSCVFARCDRPRARSHAALGRSAGFVSFRLDPLPMRTRAASADARPGHAAAPSSLPPSPIHSSIPSFSLHLLPLLPPLPPLAFPLSLSPRPPFPGASAGTHTWQCSITPHARCSHGLSLRPHTQQQPARAATSKSLSQSARGDAGAGAPIELVAFDGYDGRLLVDSTLVLMLSHAVARAAASGAPRGGLKARGM
jgi:hypothetical protein